MDDFDTMLRQRSLFEKLVRHYPQRSHAEMWDLSIDVATGNRLADDVIAERMEGAKSGATRYGPAPKVIKTARPRSH